MLWALQMEPCSERMFAWRSGQKEKTSVGQEEKTSVGHEPSYEGDHGQEG